jgi:hypothetical protein
MNVPGAGLRVEGCSRFYDTYVCVTCAPLFFRAQPLSSIPTAYSTYRYISTAHFRVVSPISLLYAYNETN